MKTREELDHRNEIVNKYRHNMSSEMRLKLKERSRKLKLKQKELYSARSKIWRENIKLEVLSHYSGGIPHCNMCGESRMVCLSIDHINGGGDKHRKEIGGGGSVIYNWLRTNKFPKGYQVLCMNCQWVKRALNGEVRH